VKFGGLTAKSQVTDEAASGLSLFFWLWFLLPLLQLQFHTEQLSAIIGRNQIPTDYAVFTIIMETRTSSTRTGINIAKLMDS
jgi:hypothetical protein